MYQSLFSLDIWNPEISLVKFSYLCFKDYWEAQILSDIPVIFQDEHLFGHVRRTPFWFQILLFWDVFSGNFSGRVCFFQVIKFVSSHNVTNLSSDISMCALVSIIVKVVNNCVELLSYCSKRQFYCGVRITNFSLLVVPFDVVFSAASNSSIPPRSSPHNMCVRFWVLLDQHQDVTISWVIIEARASASRSYPLRRLDFIIHINVLNKQTCLL